MKKTYKIHPDNIIVWPGSVSHLLIWMLLVDRYDISKFWEVFGYAYICVNLVTWLIRLYYTDTINVLKPLNRSKDENNR
jgi:hypothetical protein